MALDTEAAIMANFEFLSREGGDVDMDEDDDDDDNNDEVDTLVFDHCRAPLKVNYSIFTLFLTSSLCTVLIACFLPFFDIYFSRENCVTICTMWTLKRKKY